MRKFYKICLEEFNKYQYTFNYEDIIIPKRQTPASCGYDFYTPYQVTIKPFESKCIYTGVKVELNNDEYLMVVVRSSIAIKKGLTLQNQVGIIDSDYYNNSGNDGHIIIAMTNNTNTVVTLEKNERIAQGIIMKYYVTDDDIVNDNIRKGGFGSTNK